MTEEQIDEFADTFDRVYHETMRDLNKLGPESLPLLKQSLAALNAIQAASGASVHIQKAVGEIAKRHPELAAIAKEIL